MQKNEKMKELRVFAEEIRVTTLKAFLELGFGHVGGAMSVVELLGVLYGEVMKINPENPDWEDRDRLIMSKGHAGPAVYATLALKGYFPMEELNTINKGGTHLPSHCDKNKTIGIDMSTGSLGQGISVGAGMALGNKISAKDAYTYVCVGDGELNEGQNWEAAMFASHFKLDRLIVFVDENKYQLDGATKDIMNMGSISDKFTEFGFDAQYIDGHNVDEIYNAVQRAKECKGKPHAIVLNTIKGKGCVLTEGVFPNHHITFTKEQMQDAIEKAEKILNDARSM